MKKLVWLQIYISFHQPLKMDKIEYEVIGEDDKCWKCKDPKGTDKVPLISKSLLNQIRDKVSGDVYSCEVWFSEETSINSVIKRMRYILESNIITDMNKLNTLLNQI